jgi:hypothetical protein
VFAQHYEYRATGPLPLSGASEAIAEGYIREKNPPAHLDAPALVGRADAWWPALYAVEDTLRPIATVSFTLEVLADLTGVSGVEPLFHRARIVSNREGFFVEFRELWRGNTRLALNQQTFAILG